MAIKAVAVDDQNTQHLIIGLNRDNINSLLDGDVFTLPGGVAISITEESDIVLLFAETDEDLAKRFPQGSGQVSGSRSMDPIFHCTRQEEVIGEQKSQIHALEEGWLDWKPLLPQDTMIAARRQLKERYGSISATVSGRDSDGPGTSGGRAGRMRRGRPDVVS